MTTTTYIITIIIPLIQLLTCGNNTDFGTLARMLFVDTYSLRTVHDNQRIVYRITENHN